MAEATFAVILDNQMSGAAQEASSSLQDLRASIQGETDELRNMQTAMRAMKADASASTAQIAALQAQIDAKKSSIAAATREYVNLGGSFQKLKAGAGQGGAGIAGLEANIKKSLGPLGGTVDRVKELIGVLGSGGLYAAAALAAVAVVALTGVIVVAIAKMAKFGLTASDAARDQRILLESMTRNRAAALELQDAMTAVAAKSALTKAKVADLGMRLAEAGLRGDDFKNALEAAAIASSVGGSEAEAAFMNAAIAAAKAGEPIDDLARKMKAQFGAAAEAQVLGFRVQMMKLGESFENLFKGVKNEPFLVELAKITSLLDVSTSSGKALRAIINTMLDPIFATVAKAGPAITQFFKGMVIGALLVTIAVLKVRNALQDAFGSKDAQDGASGLKLALYAGAAAAIVIAVALVALAVVLGIVAIAVAMVALSLAILFVPFLIVVAIVIAAAAAVVAAFVFIAMAVVNTYKAIKALDFKAIGASMMEGLVSGITSGAGAVVNALRALAEKMKATIKGALGIASPSKVFAEFGLNTSAGFAEGIKGGSRDVSGAVQNMVQLPGPAMGGSNVSNSSNTTMVTINVNAPSGDAKDIVAQVERAMGDLLEGAAISYGAPLPEGV